MLTLVLAQIENLKGTVALALGLELTLHADHALACGVDGELAQIGDDPLPAQLLSHGGRSARAAEEVGDEVAFVGGSFDDAFEKSFGLLGGVICSFTCHRIDTIDICPNIVNYNTFYFVQIPFVAIICVFRFRINYTIFSFQRLKGFLAM